MSGTIEDLNYDDDSDSVTILEYRYQGGCDALEEDFHEFLKTMPSEQEALTPTPRKRIS